MPILEVVVGYRRLWPINISPFDFSKPFNYSVYLFQKPLIATNENICQEVLFAEAPGKIALSQNVHLQS